MGGAIDKTKDAAKGAATVMSGIVVFCAQNGPDEVSARFAAWLTRLGIEHVPGWLATPQADGWITLLGVACALSFGVWWFMGWKKKFYKRQRGDVDGGANKAPPIQFNGPQPNVIFKDITGTGGLKHTLVVKGPLDKLSMHAESIHLDSNNPDASTVRLEDTTASKDPEMK